MKEIFYFHLIVIPTLGLLKNYVKYKRCDPFTFLRTPIINYLFLFYFNINKNYYVNYNQYQQEINLLKSILYERYFFFIYKIIKSLYNNDYERKKEKYIGKYNLTY